MKQIKEYYVYIMTNKYRTTFYIGMTNDLRRRIAEHNESKGSFFTQKYNLNDLIYYEEFTDVNQAIAREKQLKNWKKEWKLNLVREINPNLKTLDFL